MMYVLAHWIILGIMFNLFFRGHQKYTNYNVNSFDLSFIICSEGILVIVVNKRDRNVPWIIIFLCSACSCADALCVTSPKSACLGGCVWPKFYYSKFLDCLYNLFLGNFGF